MNLYYPIKPFVVTQPFGVNGEYYQKNGINIKGHNGLDLGAKHGLPVHAAHDGYAYYEIDSKQGHGVVIEAVGFKTIYWHLCNPHIEPKYRSPIFENHRRVKAGEIIGYANNTGFSTGDHLHFGMKEIDAPGEVLNYSNGYLGAIDPTPFFNGKYAEDIGEEESGIKYQFNVDLARGDKGKDVQYLQEFLVKRGYLQPEDVVGIYGPKTQNAVYHLQVDYQIPLGLQWIYLGKYFGPKTRKVLNTIFS